MTVRLAVPAGFATEAARVCRVLEDTGLDWTVVDADAEAELRLASTEGRVGDVPPVDDAAVLGLAEPRDALVAATSTGSALGDLPSGSRIGLEGGLRRAFLGVHRPDLVAVETGRAEEALAGLDRGEIDGWIASVRLIREAGAADRILEVLEPTAWMAAPGRGAVLVEVAGAPEWASGVLASLDDLAARQALVAEAAVLEGLGAGPAWPVAVTARPHGPLLRVRALVPAASGRRLVRAEVSGRLDEAGEAGLRAARQLMARGALQLLAANLAEAS